MRHVARAELLQVEPPSLQRGQVVLTTACGSRLRFDRTHPDLARIHRAILARL